MNHQGPEAPLITPEWMPAGAAKAAAVKCIARSLEEWAILKRLTTDPRMKAVWRELTRRNRKTSAFFHPVIRRPDDTSLVDPDEIQNAALGYLFFFAFAAARDRVAVSKPSDQIPIRTLADERARVLRETADDLERLCTAEDVAALRRVAALQTQVAEALRPTGDPLSITNDHGDRVVRGVQTVIAAALEETFGRLLPRTAATLTTVALGLAEPASERVTRSAFSGRQSA